MIEEKEGFTGGNSHELEDKEDYLPEHAMESDREDYLPEDLKPERPD